MPAQVRSRFTGPFLIMAPRGLINPIITGCIIYDFPPYQMNCMTTFQFMVRKRGVTLGIPADAGGIQGEDLTLTPIPIANVAT